MSDPFAPGGGGSQTGSSGPTDLNALASIWEADTGLSIPLIDPVQPSATTPPSSFVQWVENAMTTRLGAKFQYVDPSQIASLVSKLWKDQTLQNVYMSLGDNPTAAELNATVYPAIQAALLGADQLADPTLSTDYTTLLQSQGVNLTAAELSAVNNSQAAQAAVIPTPFPAQFDVVSGNDWSNSGTLTGPSGGYGPGAGHPGVDYGTPAGTSLSTPFAGTVTNYVGINDYGNAVVITLDNGYQLVYGHIDHPLLASGTRIQPGDAVAISGQNIGDSQGAVTLVEWRSPNAQFGSGKNPDLNPHSVLDPIFKGDTTFQNLATLTGDSTFSTAAGTGQPTANKALDAEYPSIKSDWTKYFGTPPSPGDVYDVLAHGQSPQEWLDYIRSKDSHIPGIAMGAYYDLRTNAESASQTELGHGTTDSVVKSLWDAQMTTPKEVDFWYRHNGITGQGVTPQAYTAAYKAAQPYMASIYNEPANADPRVITGFAKHLMQVNEQTDTSEAQSANDPQPVSPPPPRAGAFP